MKKSVIALAVAGAFVAPSAMAVEFTPTIYQSVALSFGSNETGGVTTGAGGTGGDVAAGPDGQSMVQGGGRSIGFKVTDDLGNGMTAMMYIHWTTDSTEGNSQGPTNRNGYVGLSGNFGTVKLGTNEHVYEVGMIIDGWGADWAGGNSVGGWDGAATKIGRTGGNFTRQDNNSVWWTSPDWNGITVDAAYIMGPPTTGGANDKDASGYQAAVKWVSPMIWVQGAIASYSDYDINGGMGDFTGDTSCSVGTCTDLDGVRITVGWTPAWGFVGGTYSMMEHNAKDIATKVEANSLALTGILNMATGRLIANYIMVDDQDINGSSAADSGATGFDIGYQHDLSANTYVFARYQMNETDQNYSSVGGGKHEYDALMIGMKVSY